MNYAILNDLHIGATRVAGTTPQSAAALREHLLARLEDMLTGINQPLVILGDLFDTYNVPLDQVWKTYELLSQWLKVNSDTSLYLVAGNHDLAKDSSKFGSFDILCKMLEAYSAYAYPIYEPTRIFGGPVSVIPHLVNQESFDQAIAEVPTEAEYLLVHANYDNNFAVESDHSLNMSREQAEGLDVKHIIFAHEHQQREELDGKVIVIGNQFASSVSDCLGNETKRRAVITDEGVEFWRTWYLDENLSQQNWRDLYTDTDGAGFVRVTGEASAQEAAKVVSEIAKFRKASDAFVVTNAVNIEGTSMDLDLPDNLEEAKQFDVIEAVMEQLEPAERAAVRGLL